ncbi:MAG TPA: DUF5668 domain-containing protein [Candidatus Dormibacteraeota bacterium]|nr:DUF5668 domain-containing protein [Candidatus Dormibacteraeota bacterium]HEX2681391.1 DUF5668 domain-containing protein [Candidatus Dormibacteraeota bacterium]
MGWTRNPSTFWGGVLVLVGLLFLLANTGVLANLNWDIVWPVLLIALGVWLILPRLGVTGPITGVDAAEPREGLEKARLEIAAGGGRVEVRSAALGDQLYRAHIDHGGSTPEIKLDRATGTVRMSQKFDWLPGMGRFRLDAQLSDALPWEVVCNTGAIRGDFDLSTASVSRIEFSTGASQITLNLGLPKGVVPIKVQGGALTVDLTRPTGAAVRVQASGAAMHLSADGTRQDTIGNIDWRSSGFDGAADRYELSVAGAALNLNVRQR